VFVKHEFIKPKTIEHRSYQVSIAESALKGNTLIVLPTGMGKTVIALLVIAEVMKQRGGKILFMAPTKPLVVQHTKFLKESLNLEEKYIESFSGEVSPEKRKSKWRNAKIVVATPQVIENDILSGNIDLSEVSLMIFDEAHRTVGAYSYVFIAENYRKKRPNGLILGMTASPGSDINRIMEVCRNLDIANIEIRSKDDPDVKPYVQDIDIEWRKVELPEGFSRIINLLKQALSDRLRELKSAGALDSSSISRITKKKLLEVQEKVQRCIKEGRIGKNTFTIATLQNEALKIYHALELLQTQGATALRRFLDRLQTEARSKGGSKASKNLIRDPIIMEAIALAKGLEVDHPKIREVVEIVREEFKRNPDSRVIVFTNYRDTSIKVEESLRGIEGIRPVRFVGQMVRGEDDRGLSQKEQAEILEKFRKGDYNTLIATSVAEEGIDIPSTDLVIFYEPIPSEIRSIQRRGRTGRSRAGKVIILIAKNTLDEGFYWSALRKEKKMRRELESLRRRLKRRFEKGGISVSPSQKRLTDYMDGSGREEDLGEEDKGISVIADTRECRTQVVRNLSIAGVNVIPKQIEIGDYIISDKVCVERKSCRDFVESMMDGTLFRQLANLKNSYEIPVLIVEGEDLIASRNIRPSSIYGCLASIAIDYKIPVLFSRNQKETADLILAMARREQKEEKKDIPIRGGKKSMTLQERQQYIVEGLPNVSSILAKRLLKRFKTIRNIANAEEEELYSVDGIGRATAKDIFEVFNRPYEEGT